MAATKSLNIDQLIENVEKLHSLPTVYYRLDAAINDPHSSTSNIGNIISEDTSLSARLLKLANSAFFNFPSKVDTISMAVSIIGTRQIRDLALATSIVDMFEGISEDVIKMEDFWKHSIATGVCARVIGSMKKAPNAETFFVAGLLHDIGSLAMYTQIPKTCAKVLNYVKQNNASLIAVERKQLKADHALVGGKLLLRWKLPNHLVEAVQHHHLPSRVHVSNLIVDSVHIADIIATAMQYGNSGDFMVPQLDTTAIERVGLKPTHLPKLMDNMHKQYKDFIDIIMSK